jgi:hypothetical protein
MSEPGAIMGEPASAEEAGARVAAAPIRRGAPLGPLVFFLVLVVLGTLAVTALVVPPRRTSGLPDDPDVAAARALLHDRAALRGTGSLRLESALLGDAMHGDPVTPPGAEDLARARRHLEAARRRHPFDARVRAALGALDLVMLRLASAERRYREALDLSPEYAEARLGMGVVLAVRAATEGDPSRVRGLRLRALAQWRAVPAGDPARDAALYNGAITLAEAGWLAEAERWAGEFQALDPGSRWSDTVRAALEAARRSE